MNSLEERVTACWSPGVRPLVVEAHRCYVTGSARAAIVLTWTAVCADIIDKLRRLAEDGDGDAKTLVDRVESVQGRVTQDAIKTMQEVEGQLLGIALAMELIDEVEQRKLDQLRLDRNLCAHPSLGPLGDVFAPTLDDARAHLAVALEALLTHAPSQGRSVVKRMIALLSDPSFPGSEDFIAHTYFDRVKPAVRRSLVNLVVKHALLELDAEGLDPQELADRCAVCVAAFAARDRVLVRQQLAQVAPGLSQKAVAVQMRAAARLGHLDLFWEVTEQAMHQQLDRVIAALNVQFAAFGGLKPEDLAVLSLVSQDRAREALPALEAKFEDLPEANQASAIGRRPGRYFVPRLADLLRGATSYRSAESVCQAAVLTCAPWFTAQDLASILDAWAETYDCRMAAAMPRHAVTLYRATRQLPSAPETWRNFVARVDALAAEGEEYYRYPELAALL
ncbi:hypothetical protein [Streptacidiphilus anmyonensis]|uniref:hypothetical protein n=1 Tax=Streptacidiphilus anmyonensis TaxID=405782 RepID=UPI0005AAB152|nr:hypothetical protein [Streptacidiphilus anmyonensis]